MIKEKVSHWRTVLNRGWQVLTQQRARILAYHSVSDERTDEWSISPRQFEQHMQLLRANNIKVVKLEQLVAQIQHGLSLEKTVAITFDDAYCDFLHHAAPILRNYDLPATLFVPVSVLGMTSVWSQKTPDAPIMSVKEVAQVRKQGFTIGSHSMTHHRLPTLSNSVLIEELQRSQEWLQQKLGVEWMAFAYPFGDFGEREALTAKAAGYECAVGFGGLWGNGHETDLFALNRDAIARSCHKRTFQSILDGRRDWINAATISGSSLIAFWE